jgi:yecA family protein
MTESLSYRQMQHVTANGAADASVAELHGAMTGLLCADVHSTYEQWLAAVFTEGEAPLDHAAEAPLRTLFATTQQGLASGDLSFEPLLPDDDEPLSERAEALGYWCLGFLYGLGQTTGPRAWSSEAEELLKDFADISRLEAAEDTDDENDYVEIAEFVRVGIQLIRHECEGPTSTRLH